MDERHFQASLVATALSALLANHVASRVSGPLPDSIAKANEKRSRLLDGIIAAYGLKLPESPAGSRRTTSELLQDEKEFASLLADVGSPGEYLDELRQLSENVIAALRSIPDSPNKRRRGNLEKDLMAALDDGTRSSSANDEHDIRVWFGTNRQRKQTADGRYEFTAQRAESVSYGTCLVHIPESHRVGGRGSNWLFKLLHGDDTVRLKETDVLEEASFWGNLKASVQACDDDTRSAIVFIHGYNMSFEKTAICAGQLAADLAVSSAFAFFSWPSQGTMLDYLADEATIELSAKAIESFLVDFAAKSGADTVHIIAHSMGNRGLLEAIRTITANAEKRLACRFGQIILAAPDVDAGVFKLRAGCYADAAKQTTVYVSKADLAVRASRALHAYDRAGYPPVIVLDKIDSVDVTRVNVDFIGHGYVTDSRPVITDMYQMIATGAGPGKRATLRPSKDRSHWEIR